MTKLPMSAHIIRGDARALPLPDASVDLIVTSPPFWGLRSYTDGGRHYDGQIGAEPTPAAYVDDLITCTAEWMRVLKPSGSLWVNLGDKYSDRGHGACRGRGTSRGPQAETLKQTRGPREKSLLGLPWRYAIACMDELELILRAEVIWSKPNGLPESVTDRVRRAHETWFHFTLGQRYYAAVDAIREPIGEPKTRGRNPNGPSPDAWDRGTPTLRPHPLGKLPGSVREVATQPLRVPAEIDVDHFAAFPMEWPRWIISGWSPSGICTACSEGRRPIVERPAGASWHSHGDDHGSGQRQDGAARNRAYRARVAAGVGPTITGEACACESASSPTRPAVVLDPFGGTGTTALVASALGRRGISIDMSADYCRLAAWRTSDPKQRERAGAARTTRRATKPAKPSPRGGWEEPMIPALEKIDGGAA